ncbi:hypothetical protein AMATHDRAFT_50515 [Amanita thiersii Skay4041]|uniref:Uncharacterized protein n=1 Tax=Amanita thiersii Skay4041 TaxID=703135 RepID=A0A2A9N9A9_9AGAR|nr:hypothetical protein AMATHDRAFT_50515 [Amanita thiersii Skay4041]
MCFFAVLATGVPLLAGISNAISIQPGEAAEVHIPRRSMNNNVAPRDGVRRKGKASTPHGASFFFPCARKDIILYSVPQAHAKLDIDDEKISEGLGESTMILCKSSSTTSHSGAETSPLVRRSSQQNPQNGRNGRTGRGGQNNQSTSRHRQSPEPGPLTQLHQTHQLPLSIQIPPLAPGLSAPPNSPASSPHLGPARFGEQDLAQGLPGPRRLGTQGSRVGPGGLRTPPGNEDQEEFEFRRFINPPPPLPHE